MESPAETLDVDAVIGYSDSLLAGLYLFFMRARVGVAVYIVLTAAVAFAAWTSGATWLTVAAISLVVLAALPLAFVARVTQLDFQSRGGKPLSLHYHVCPSGFEAVAGGREGWLAWDDLWDATETGEYFLICPSPQEQYVVPKRYLDAHGTALLRGYLAGAGKQPA